MLNLLNSDEKRGVVILSAKEYKRLSKALETLNVCNAAMVVETDYVIRTGSAGRDLLNHIEQCGKAIVEAKSIIR